VFGGEFAREFASKWAKAVICIVARGRVGRVGRVFSRKVIWKVHFPIVLSARKTILLASPPFWPPRKCGF
jgi:hypothetical protein